MSCVGYTYKVCYNTTYVFTFAQLPQFVARWRELRLTDDDLRELKASVLENPEVGAVVAGTGGLRKIRYAPPSRHTGRRGAMRVGYAYFRIGQIVYLVSIFAKNDQANFSAGEKQEIKKLLAIVGQHHR